MFKLRITWAPNEKVKNLRQCFLNWACNTSKFGPFRSWDNQKASEGNCMLYCFSDIRKCLKLRAITKVSCRPLHQHFDLEGLLIETVATLLGDSCKTLEGHFNTQWCYAGLRDRPTLVSPFRKRPPRCPWSTYAALCGWFQSGISADKEHESSQFSYCFMRLAEEVGTTDQFCQM